MVPCDNLFTMRFKSIFPALISAFLLSAATRAESTPSFELEVSSGGITHLAVGEKLQLRVYLPQVRRDPSQPVSPLPSAMTWRVDPVDFASVNSEGLLTALRPGQVRVTVEAANVPKGELGPGMPGARSLTILRDLPGGRLPRLDGMPEFEEFTVAWDQSGSDHNRGLFVGLRTFTWSVGVTTSAPPEGPLPWTLDAVPEQSQFNDDRGYSDIFSQDDFKRWQRNLTSARLTIASWKDGIASGRLEFKTSRGVNMDTTFHAWVEDRSGVLAVRADPAPAVPVSIRVVGDVETPGEWTADRIRKDLAADVREVTVTLKGKQSKAHCVPLLSLVDAAKLKVDPKIRKHRIAFVISVRGRDGYTAAFSVGEVEAELGKRDVWVALDHDGVAFDAEHAPVEILVLGDEKFARWVRGVESISVIDTVRIVPK